MRPDGHQRRTGKATGATPARTWPTVAAATRHLHEHHGGDLSTFDYHDADGTLVGRVVRVDKDGSKAIRPLALKDGRWHRTAMPVPRPLYGLRALSPNDQQTVFVFEGEKCADEARRIGLQATTSAGGSNAAKQTDWSPLAGRDVIIVPDNDDAGEGYFQAVSDALAMLTPKVNVRVLRIPNADAGHDIADWIALRTGQPPNLVRRQWDDLVRSEATEVTPSVQDRGLAAMTSFDEIEPQEVQWLWPGRIPQGRLTLLVGAPGGGKSFVCCDIAARISTGRDMPDGSTGSLGDTILIACEDDPGDTLRPRLDALGAEVSRIHLLRGVNAQGHNQESSPRLFTLADIAALEDALQRRPETRLIVVDPIGSYLGSRVDAYRDNEVRSVLAPLAELARRRNVAVLLVAHTKKGGASTADESALGSRAFTGIARSVLHLMRPKENPSRRLLLPRPSRQPGLEACWLVG